ncbi:MAG: S8 family serine peptidase [Verrucomicrobiales bacterium]
MILPARRLVLLLPMLFAIDSVFGQSSEPLEIFDAGVTREFELAFDQLALGPRGGRLRLESVVPRRSRGEMLGTARARRFGNEDVAHVVLYEKGKVRETKNLRILTQQVLVELEPGAVPEDVLDQISWQNFEAPSFAENFIIIHLRSLSDPVSVAQMLRERDGVVSAEPMLARYQKRRLIPNDPVFGDQWHLRNTGQNGGSVGADVQITGVWDTFLGTGVRIGIVDDGLQHTHPDLSANVDTTLSRNWNSGSSTNAAPDVRYDDHGTPCAGVAAARGNNSAGVTGAAPRATLVGMRLIAGAVSDSQEAEAMAYRKDAIHVKSNSWGPNDDGRTLEAPGSLTRAALADATATGRGGRGTIFVWSGGNGLEDNDNSNYDGYANSIHTIAVGAVGNQGQQAYYSEPGANIVIVAPSSHTGHGISTTDLIGSNGYNTNSTSGDYSNRDYTRWFGGTSSSAPLAAGVIALMLEANPQLGWRDVQEILIRSATRTRPADGDWITNAAGYHFNHKFGAGIINAAAAVGMAESWTQLPTQTSFTSTQSGLSVGIPDNSANGITRSFNFSSAQNLRVEHVTVTVNINHQKRGDLAITLTAPSGVQSRLAEKRSDGNSNYSNWTFMTVRNWGESSQGTWTLRVADLTSGTTGTLTSASITVYGASQSQAPVITSAGTASGVRGSPFSYQIAATNSPTSFSASGLPSGLTLNSATGLISGSPSVQGVFGVQVGATNAAGTGTANLNLSITDNVPVITSPVSATATEGVSFSYQITATNTPTSFGATGLPAGLTVNSSNGLISGTTTAVGQFPVTLSASNVHGMGNQALTLTVQTVPVNPLAQAIDNSSLNPVTYGNANWFRQTSVTWDGVDAAQSGSITHNQSTTMEANIAGPAELAFYWKVSSESGYDFLEVLVNGEVQRRISGEVDWQASLISLPAGNNVVRWRYSKDGSVSQGQDRGWVDQVVFFDESSLPTIAEAVDAPELTFSTGGNVPWAVNPFEGLNNAGAARSGAITDNQESWVQTTVAGAGELRFFWKVSSETDYDFLRFLINGQEQERISGELGWSQRSYVLGEGTHILRWVYDKDESVSAGQDNGWLDQVVWVPAVPEVPTLSYQEWLNDLFTLEEQADPLLTGPRADFDGNGLSNLYEYASGTNPREAQSSRPPEVIYEEIDDVSYLTVTYWLDQTRTGATMHVESKVRLDDPMWTRVEIAAEPVETEGDASMMRVRIPAVESSLFARIVITLQP